MNWLKSTDSAGMYDFRNSLRGEAKGAEGGWGELVGSAHVYAVWPVPPGMGAES
jgi:hypothetical protein